MPVSKIEYGFDPIFSESASEDIWQIGQIGPR